MNRLILFLFLMPGICTAQFVSGFESQVLDTVAGYYMGAATSDGFNDNGIYFRNNYNATFQYWDGFALSRKTDSITAGYSNQFSCRAGRAWEGNTFALAYASSRIFLKRSAGEAPRRLLNFRLSNSTYAARSMQTGDAFAKKFGGPSGLDPDYFRLHVYNYRNGSITDSAMFYLADYRAPGVSNDYILNKWIQADLNFSNPFDSVGFELSSSDMGAFGMNTPAYFCMDQVVSEAVSALEEQAGNAIRVFPNPTDGIIRLHLDQPDNWVLLDANGRCLMSGSGLAGDQYINLSGVPSGVYMVVLSSGMRKRICRR